MDLDGPRRGARDNGLRCGGYVAVADLDPRIADALLEALRDNGIAAYAAPTPGSVGGAMETRLPDRPIDRLWVDATNVERARSVIERESGDPEPPLPTTATTPAPPMTAATAATPPAQTSPAEGDVDFDAAWQQVLASLQSSGPPMPSWPQPDAGSTPTAGDRDEAADEDEPELVDPADEEHFEPPAPPPLPRLRPVTLAALTAIVLGILILTTNVDDGGLWPLGIAGVLGGVASLVWNMRNGPPTDSGWDDGAVV